MNKRDSNLLTNDFISYVSKIYTYCQNVLDIEC